MRSKSSYGRLLILSAGLVCTLLTALTLALRSELELVPEQGIAPSPAGSELHGLLSEEGEGTSSYDKTAGSEPASSRGKEEEAPTASPLAESSGETPPMSDTPRVVSGRPAPSEEQAPLPEENADSSIESAPPSSHEESAAASSAPGSSTPVSSAVDLAALQTDNDRRAEKLSNETGILIIILREKWPEAEPAGELAAAEALSVTEEAFVGYGNGLLAQAIERLILAVLPTGEQLRFEGKSLLVNCMTIRWRELRGVFYTSAEGLLLAEGVPTLSSFLPADFYYGRQMEQYVWRQGNDPAFLSAAGQTSVRADFCELFRAVLEDPAWVCTVPKESLLYEKLCFCCALYEARLPALRQNVAVLYFMAE